MLSIYCDSKEKWETAHSLHQPVKKQRITYFVMKHRAFSFMSTEPAVPFWIWAKIYHLPCGFNNTIDNNIEIDNGDDDDAVSFIIQYYYNFKFTIIWLLFFIGDKGNRLQYDPFYTNPEARKVQFFIFISRSTSRQSCTSLIRREEGYFWWNRGNNNIKLYAIIKKKNKICFSTIQKCHTFKLQGLNLFSSDICTGLCTSL